MERLRPGLLLSERYRLAGHVASGGMGQVWEAVDDVLQRRVALKIMHPHTQDELELVERFRDEARFAAQLMHPHIVTIHDFADFDGLAFLVMEMVDGRSLAQVLAGGPLSGQRTRALLRELASALIVAHSAGIIHRDIKPANVLVSPTGAKLTDFGIARSIDGDSHTLVDQVLGTANYLSPEHALGHKLSPASDIYGLGVLTHEALTGLRPFERSTPIATALAHVQDPPPPLPDGTPSDLATLIGACLKKDPAERPTATTLVEKLDPDDAGAMFGDSAETGAVNGSDVNDPEPTAALVAVPRRALG